MRLLCYSVLVGPDGAWGVAELGVVSVGGGIDDVIGRCKGEAVDVGCVDCGDNAGVVLEFEEVCRCGGSCFAEGIGEKWVVWTKGEVVDDVGEIKFWQS